MQREPMSGRIVMADEEGAVTAEYAIATIAAVGFAALLVRGLLLGLVTRALAMPS
jgi:hypothetical protein